ncbi:MAG: glutamate--tRNA ligase [Candidatus Paceibacterota bacterium]
MNKKEKVRVRFAPSPTGPLTLGNARTALFNWLYAKHNNGEFLIRIEDTDKKRSEKKFEEDILEGLKWLSLNWDSKIERQSERTEIYKKYLEKLIEEEHAYYCFCSPKKLEEEREAQLSQGLAPKYPGTCKKIGKAEAKERVNTGEKSVIRFKMPRGIISFTDIIRGKVKFDSSLIGDFVIAKDLESPLYNFAVVIDDNDMNITHVIRGEDHISNTPRQIAVQKILELKEPTYAHLPLILAPGGKKLSKRHMQKKSIIEYKEDGYLMEAMFNFLALLGWHPKEDREVINMEETIKEFTLKRVQKSGGIMNEEKLNWYNSYYIKNTDTDKLVENIKPFISKEWSREEGKLKKVLEIEKERMKSLKDFKNNAKIFFEEIDYEQDLLIWKNKSKESYESLLKIFEFIHELNEEKFNSKNIEKFLLKLSDEVGGKGEVYHPFRVALSGAASSPGALEMISVLGKEQTEKRLSSAIEKLEK